MKHSEVIARMGGTNIKGYTLVNNYGYQFSLGGRKYDVRFWANCYGAYIGKWEVMPVSLAGCAYEPPSADAVRIQESLNALGPEL